MKKEKQEELGNEDKKAVKLKKKEEKKELKLKKKEERETKKIKGKKEKKKLDKTVIFTKIMAACLVAFTLLGTCYTFIYLILNG